jgi:hypothetical protein
VNTGEQKAQERGIAYHEAGHAVVAAMLGILPKKSGITIVPDKKGVLGSVSFSRNAGFHDSGKRWSPRYTRKIILAQYAGPAVSKKLVPGLDLLEEGGYCEGDMIFSEHLMRSCEIPSCEWIGDPAFTAFKERAWDEAVALVESNWSAIKAVAKALLERHALSGVQVLSILKKLTQ